jgi:hypothetical protein
VVLETVSVEVERGEEWAKTVDALDGFDGDILSANAS